MEETNNKEYSLESALETWAAYPFDKRKEVFYSLPRHEAEELFLNLNANNQAELFLELPGYERRSWIRLLAPDDVADLIQELPKDYQAQSIELLDPVTKNEVNALLAYAEDEAGGLMNSRFARLRPEMRVSEAISYLRAQSRAQIETIYYAYVLDQHQKLMGVVTLRELFNTFPTKVISEIMTTDLVTIHDTMDQEEIGKIFSQQNYLALPVVDEENVMKGIITVDDVVETMQEDATEDIQKIGGSEALGEPYLDISLFSMIKKRAGWLMVLFVGELFTASAMKIFEEEISKAVVLALFIPLVISSGGNSGSQASTLIIRAMALGEVRIRDWWRVFVREIASGLGLGLILAILGFLRIFVWGDAYGEHYSLIALSVSCSLIGIVLWGTIAGSMLPFVLKKAGLDPATASAPFVATLVDVSGLVIYFSVAHFFLKGILL